MLTYTNLVRPSTLEEANAEYQKVKTAALLGGCCWLRLGRASIVKAVDLSGLGLRYIRETETEIQLGAMATLRDMETSPVLQAYAGGAAASCVHSILGVQFRECATIGGSVASKFGFSDILPTFLALGAEVELFGKGRMAMKEYLACPRMHELLVQVILPKKNIWAAHEALRKSQSDFPYLTGAVAEENGCWTVVIGCRPGAAVIAEKASALLTEQGASAAEEAAQLAAEEVTFQTNSHASAAYRKEMAAVVVRRLVKEVETWK